jgi:hypothetical protein
MDGLERRREERISCKLKVGEVNGQYCAGTYLFDISSLGAQLEIGYPIAIGDSAEFSLSLPSGRLEEQEAYHFAGRVAWIKRIDLAPRRYRIGLSFFTQIKDWKQILAGILYQPGNQYFWGSPPGLPQHTVIRA